MGGGTVKRLDYSITIEVNTPGLLETLKHLEQLGIVRVLSVTFLGETQWAYPAEPKNGLGL